MSIGVPVFNGQASLATALDSLLAQDYPNLEIVVSDNGSTDRTPEICARYACMDPRVKWSRSEDNRGAVWNFNRVLELASGPYFMWAAHDDQRAPAFVSACVERLQQEPEAVLCMPHIVVMIEGRPEPVYVATLDTFVSTLDQAARYRETLRFGPPHLIYGLYRTAAIRATQKFLPLIATDVAFLLELSLQGRFVSVAQELMTYRVRSTWNTIHDDARAFLGRHRRPWWYVPFVMLFWSHVDRLRRASIPLATKLRLCAVLLRHESGRLLRRAVVRLLGVVLPSSGRERLARVIYWRWMHNPNFHVLDEQMFFQRMCKPQFGWWR